MYINVGAMARILDENLKHGWKKKKKEDSGQGHLDYIGLLVHPLK